MVLTTRVAKQAQITALARPAVAALAPAELPMLEVTVAASLRRSAGRRVSRSADMLGFGGWDESVSVLTLAAIGTAQAVLVFIGETLREEASHAVRTRVRGWFTKRALRKASQKQASQDQAGQEQAGQDQAGLPAATELDDDELRRVREVALATARDFGLDEGAAGVLADAIIGRLGRPLEEEDDDNDDDRA